MPGKSTYYSRIQVMLELAGSYKPQSSDGFINSIVRKSPPNFVYHRWNPMEEKYSGKCSESAVRKTFELAVDLGLLKKASGALTKEGKTAASPKSYDMVLRTRLQSFLKQHKCSAEKLAQASKVMLRRNEIILPTADELYLEVCVSQGGDLSEFKFKKLLQLLALSGGISISRRHIFLPSKDIG